MIHGFQRYSTNLRDLSKFLLASFFIPAILLGAPFLGAATSNDLFSRALDGRMPGLIAKYGVPGAVVSCISNGEVVWTKAFGYANLKTGALMRTDMVFNHGSNGKVLTVWGTMRLVEQGKIDLDAPANRYLKRWRLHSSQFDPAGVTIRRLLSHTAGLTVQGFLDYDQRRRLPSLVEILEGKNQIQLFGESNGPVFIKWQPGEVYIYSGGGFVILQMIIEDVTGEPFAEFMQSEVVAPLGLHRLEWMWTRELEKSAPMSYGDLQEEIGYRQLACQAVGSEICTVPDFARFVAAMSTGPHGEPAGRGVLKPETVASIFKPLPSGLGYGFSGAVEHSGANPGWCTKFLFDTMRREGFVIANNSYPPGLNLNRAVQNIWDNIILGIEPRPDPMPGKTLTIWINSVAVKVAVVVWIFLFVITGICVLQIVRGRRHASRPRLRRSLLLLVPPNLLLFTWWYLFYAPQYIPLPLPTTFLSIWRLPLVNYIMALFLGWLGVGILFTFFSPIRQKKLAKITAHWS
jgi:CubicO group peptidase (beta-lactamase class C family)